MDDAFMQRLEQFCDAGTIEYSTREVSYDAPVGAEAQARASRVAESFRRRRALIMMLGDTSMGMINGYFGPRLLNRHGFTEHKIDQAWLIDRGRGITDERIDDAFSFVKAKGVTFHWGEANAEDFTERDTREQLRDYLSVLDLYEEFKADCIGWQYQLGLINLRAPSDFAEGLLNSACRPEGNGDTIATATEADQGNAVPMEMLKRLLKDKGLHQAVMFHDVRWGAEHDGRSRCVVDSGRRPYASTTTPTRSFVHTYVSRANTFRSGGTLPASLPGAMTWGRYAKAARWWTRQRRGRRLPPDVRAPFDGTTRDGRSWRRHGLGRDTRCARPQQPVAVPMGRVRRDGRAEQRDGLQAARAR